MGSSYNQEYVNATEDTNRSNEAVATDTNKTDLSVAQQQSQAVIEQAKYDYEARIYEADKNYAIQMEALRVREKEAELTYKVDWKNAENDAIRAEASQTTADAKIMDAENDAQKEQDRQDYKMAQLSGDGYSQFYG